MNASPVVTDASPVVAGTLAILLHAKQRGLLSLARPEIDGLITEGFRLSDALREMVLHKAREMPD